MQIMWLATAMALIGFSQEAPEAPESPMPTFDAKSLGYVARPSGPFPNPGEIETTRLVVSIREDLDDQLLHYTDTLLEGDRVIDVAPADRKLLGLSTKPNVWLFGHSAPCKAKVGKPYAQAHDEGSVALEVGYRLKPCGKNPAPIAHLGDTPPDLRWKTAKVELSERVDLTQWKHPARQTLEGWGLAEWEGKTPTVYARIARAHNAHELGYAHYLPGTDECGSEEESTVVRIALWSGKTFSELPAVEEALGGEALVGELTFEDATIAVVATLRYQMYVWVAAMPTTWTEFRTGSYHDEDVAYSGWSVLQNPCEP